MKRSAICLLASCSLLFACSSPTEKGSENGAGASAQATTSKPAAKRVGVYGFDGTNNIPSHDTVVSRFVNAAQAPVKRYFEGTDLLAGNYRSIVERGIEKICEDQKASPFDTVVLVGYSRGAIAAYESAARLRDACGKPVPVRWVGLFDAVATNVEDSLKRGTAGRNFLDTRCFHATKSHDSRPFLDTASALSCQMRQFKADHSVISQSAEAFAVLRDDANGVVPGLFPVTSGGSTKPAEKVDACSVNSDLRSCFIAGCTWSDAQCEATKK